MPRLGGLAVLIGITATVGLLMVVPGLPSTPANRTIYATAAGLVPILCVSILDDMKGVSAKYKLAGHVVGAGLAVAFGARLGAHAHLFGGTFTIELLAIPLSVVWLIGVTNAFNLVDGLDGLSAGLALISALGLAAVSATGGDGPGTVLALTVAGALAGFMPHNFYPARMFLGDTGATAVGFCLGALALKGGTVLSGGLATLVPILIIGLPITDTLLSIFRRVVRGSTRDLFRADRKHIHHRLLDLGVSHRSAVVLLYGAALVTATVALVSLFVTRKQAALLLLSLLVAAIAGIRRLKYEEFSDIPRAAVLRVYDRGVVTTSSFTPLIDLILIAASVYISFAFRFETWLLAPHQEEALELFTLIAPISVGSLWVAGVYRVSWRIATADHFALLAKGTVIGAVATGVLVTLTGLGGSIALTTMSSTIMLVLASILRGLHQRLAYPGHLLPYADPAYSRELAEAGVSVRQKSRVPGPSTDRVCPRCAQGQLLRSHTRSRIERIRKAYTSRRPHRCAKCGWRGWVLPMSAGLFFCDQQCADSPNLQELDLALAHEPR